MNIVIVGSTGQVARELQRELKSHQLICLDRQVLDLSAPDAIRSILLQHRPQLLINAAAYTAVDLAEQEPDLAFTINAQAPGIMAQTCAELGIPLIHYSTDYVFDGQGQQAFSENDATHPLSVYGASKLAGEQAIIASGCKHLILRTSWVYSEYGRNFLLTMQRLLSERENLNVVADQIGAPTWAGSIARATAELIDSITHGNQHWGTYHLSCQDHTSWYGFACAIAETLEQQNLPCAQLHPIASEAYPTPAKRPLNSRLNGQKLLRDWHIQLPTWQHAFAQCIARQQHT